MKVGTLVQHHMWGKAIVTEILENEPFKPIRVAWLTPVTDIFGPKVPTSTVWQQETIILSEGE